MNNRIELCAIVLAAAHICVPVCRADLLVDGFCWEVLADDPTIGAVTPIFDQPGFPDGFYSADGFQTDGRIYHIATDGTVSDFADLTDEPYTLGLWYPSFDSAGQFGGGLVVGDNGPPGSFWRIGAGGAVEFLFSTQGDNEYFAVDRSGIAGGDLFIAKFETGELLRANSAGEVSLFATGLGLQGSGAFAQPLEGPLAGRLLVTETYLFDGPQRVLITGDEHQDGDELELFADLTSLNFLDVFWIAVSEEGPFGESLVYASGNTTQGQRVVRLNPDGSFLDYFQANGPLSPQGILTAGPFAGSMYGTANDRLYLVNPTDCPANIVRDCQVNFEDLLRVLDAWGECAPGSDCLEDLDDDGAVGFNDLLIVLDGWGPCT